MFRKELDPVITIKDKAVRFFAVHWKGVVCVLTPLIWIVVLQPFPPEKFQICAYTLLVMATYWVTECIPLPITSFLPLIIFPMTNVMSTEAVAQCYINDSILMFIGSMILAESIEQCGLHRRLALGAIRCIGYSHYRLLFALCFITTFISLWITNTAATMMMIPICFAILRVFEEQGLLKLFEKNSQGEDVATDITTCYFCSLTFSATIGGIGTLVGTVTNLVFKGLFMGRFPKADDYLSFSLFSAFTLPLLICVEASMYLCMIIVYFGFLRKKSRQAKSAKLTPEAVEAIKKKVSEETKKIGKITLWEILVIILFASAMLLFFSRSPQVFPGWGDKLVEAYGIEDKKFVKDSAAAYLIVVLMVLIPNSLMFFNNCKAKYVEDLPKGAVRGVIDWKRTNNVLPYGFMFLLGGGLALSQCAKKEYTDLNGKIGEFLSKLETLPNYLIILILIVFTMFVTLFASNAAVCNVVAPIAIQMAINIKQNPLWYCVAVGIAASFCFCIPVGTPGNVIVQSNAQVSTKKMIIAGLGPTTCAVILLWLFVSFWAPVVWPILHTPVPKWVAEG